MDEISGDVDVSWTDQMDVHEEEKQYSETETNYNEQCNQSPPPSDTNQSPPHRKPNYELTRYDFNTKYSNNIIIPIDIKLFKDGIYDVCMVSPHLAGAYDRRFTIEYDSKSLNSFLCTLFRDSMVFAGIPQNAIFLFYGNSKRPLLLKLWKQFRECRNRRLPPSLIFPRKYIKQINNQCGRALYNSTTAAENVMKMCKYFKIYEYMFN